MKLAIEVWKRTFNILKKRPGVVVPFVIGAVFSGVGLWVLYLAPVRPVSIVLAPPIRSFFGEKFLHYPFSVLLLPKLFQFAQLALSATIGVIMTGLAIGMFKNACEEKGLKGKVNLVNSFKRYFALFGVWVVMFLFSFLSRKLTNRLCSGLSPQLFAALLTYTMAMFVQIVFIYAMPIIIIEKKKLLSALKQGLLFFKKFFLTSVVLTMIPAFLYFPMVALGQYLPKLIKKFSPEAVIVFLGLGILVTFIMDIFLTLSPTLLLLKERSGGKLNKGEEKDG